ISTRTLIRELHMIGFSKQRFTQMFIAIMGVAAVGALAGCAVSRPASEATLATQRNVDLNRYAGVWYEQARLPNRFQADCTGEVKADYTLEANNVIRVV